MYSFVTGKLFTESETHCTEQRTPTKPPRRSDRTGETSVARFEWLYELASDTTDALWICEANTQDHLEPSSDSKNYGETCKP